MAYSQKTNIASQKYVKEKQKSILIKFKKDIYEQEIEPAIRKSGLPIVTFIKDAIYEKCERDGLLN